MFLPEPAFFVVALLMIGTGGIFFWHDRERPASRALSTCMSAIGLRLLLSGYETGEMMALVSSAPFQWAVIGLEGIAIYAGIEWGRRVAQTGTYPPGRTTMRLFRSAQALIVLFVLLRLLADTWMPELAREQSEGVSRITSLQWFLFAPSLLIGIVLVGIAISRLRAVRIDEAERVRLQALSLAGPFLLSALFLGEEYVPVTLALGLLIFLWGSVRYLILQGRRGQFMRQFLSPEVARLVQLEGMERTLQRERRVLTVVACDLRGFTRYAREHGSADVTQVLEQYYALVGRVAARHAGTVKDHAGDGVLILVGAPLPVAEHERRAVALALELTASGQQLLQEIAPELGLGIGLATGNTTVGAIHGANRLEYVAVGNAVNLAARLCDRARDGEVLADLRTAQALSQDDQVQVEERQPEPLKGFVEPIPVCALGGACSYEWLEEPKKRRRGRRRRHRRGKSRS